MGTVKILRYHQVVTPLDKFAVRVNIIHYNILCE